MRHCTIDELLALDEAGTEPGAAWTREHLAGCDACRAERDRLDQRRARLRALPPLRPPRDHWPAVRARARQERQARRLRYAGLGGLLLAASVALAVVVGGGRAGLPQPVAAPDREALAAEHRLEDMMRRSQALEAAISAYDPDARVIDGRTGMIAAGLEDRIAEIDRRLQAVRLEAPDGRPDAVLPLWQERVGLLDALVDVHVTRASHVGL